MDSHRKVLNKESVPDLPSEIDAAQNPLAVESTQLVGAYTADFHHRPQPPQPQYSVEAVAQELAQHKTVDGVDGSSSDGHRTPAVAGTNGQTDGAAGSHRAG